MSNSWCCLLPLTYLVLTSHPRWSFMQSLPKYFRVLKNATTSLPWYLDLIIQMQGARKLFSVLVHHPWHYFSSLFDLMDVWNLLQFGTLNSIHWQTTCDYIFNFVSLSPIRSHGITSVFGDNAWLMRKGSYVVVYSSCLRLVGLSISYP